jgi:hypothetical protein
MDTRTPRSDETSDIDEFPRRTIRKLAPNGLVGNSSCLVAKGLLMRGDAASPRPAGFLPGNAVPFIEAAIPCTTRPVGPAAGPVEPHHPLPSQRKRPGGPPRRTRRQWRARSSPGGMSPTRRYRRAGTDMQERSRRCGCSWGCPSPFATNLKQRDMSGVIAGSQLEEGGVAGQFGETATSRSSGLLPSGRSRRRDAGV